MAQGNFTGRSRSSSLSKEGDADEVPQVSIASLRSKFENLAAGKNVTGTGSGAGNDSSIISAAHTGLRIRETDSEQLHVQSGLTLPVRPASVVLSRPESTPRRSPPAVPSPLPSASQLAPHIDERPASVTLPIAHTPSLGGHATEQPPLVPKLLRRPAPTPPSGTATSFPSLLTTATPPVSSTMSTPPSTTGSSASDSGVDDTDRRASVKALRERFAQASASGLPLPRPTSPRRVSSEAIHKQSSHPFHASNSAEATLSSSPEKLALLSETRALNRGKLPPPPPPPISRSASPAPIPTPPAAPIAVLLTVSPSTTPILSRSPSTSSLPPPVPPPPLSTTAPPQLPARKPATPQLDTPSAVPPPVPGNRPIASPSLPPLSASTEVPAPPRLPERPRAHTISRIEPVAPVLTSTPPRLPVRTPTVNSTMSTSSTASSSSPQRARELSGDSYLPPPPPVRNTTASAGPGSSTVTGIPPRRAGSGGVSNVIPATANGDASSEEEEEGGIAVPALTTMAQRMLDEHPDTTQANRRPPKFVPDVRLTYPHVISAFAVYGRYVCVGHHHVRVYDTTMGDQPILHVDLRDIGLDFRVKEPRVTAMCFRPGANLSQEGRYLWCGTKDGHLWELDVKTGIVTATRAFVHPAAVTYIFRHQRWVITLDESGKMYVWEVFPSSGDTLADDDRGSVKQFRTLRVSDKLTFAKMINGRLWTATAPAVRSTTNAAGSRGPTIRLYDPCYPGIVPPAQTVLTTEWTGAATSATIMPFKPDQILIGHEGGFVSIWSGGRDLACLQVLKISSSDILSLEGVGEKLWAGNRKGQIHVYDISDRPWLATNIWTAHPDQPVHTLIVDPWSIEHSGRFTLWSCSRDQLRAWDGLLSVDWIDSKMVDRQPDYCALREAKVLVCSWNIDSAKPSDLTGSVENASFLEQCLRSIDSPDIIVFGFQEVIPLTDKKLTAKTLLFGNKGKDGGQMADRVSAAYRMWLEKLQYAVRLAMPPDCPYVKVHSESLVGLFTCIFIKASEKDSLRDVNITTVKRGIGGIYGNKGAIVARMVIDDTSICFINVHLAAGQRHKAARNADIAAIMEDKAIFPPSDELPYVHGGDGTGILDHEMVVLNGDLNYRIDQRRENVISSIQAGDLAFLLDHDQLRKEMRGNHAFRLRSFEEAPITFAPTYKYDQGTNDYDSSEKRRIPAWCDRILYTRCARIKPINYQRYETTASDHRPISAALSFQIKCVDPIRMQVVRREVSADWRKRESEMLDKMSDAYSSLL